MITIERDEALSRVGRRKVVYRAVCSCGWESRWATGRWWADAKRDEHEPKCPGSGPMLVGHFEPLSDEWHAARAAGLGGSEVAAVLGLSKWESEFSLWHRKAGEWTGTRDNDEMEAGRRLEPVIVQKFADEHPEFHVHNPAGTWRHPDRAWQIANPDATLYPRQSGYKAGDRPTALLETKFALYDDEWGEPGSDDIPIYYRCQVQWYLDVFDLDVCFVEVFIGSQGAFREYVVKADAADQATLREKGAAFMARVAAGDRPPIDGHNATYEVVRDLHPDIAPMQVETPVELARLFCGAKAAEKAAKVEAQRATALLADHMGSAQRAAFAGRTLASRQARGGGVPYVVAARGLPTFDMEESA